MTLVTLLSTLAMILGLGGILPQLGKMIRSRSAGGQAVLGWGMGCAAHASMAYVNFFGFHSTLLSASNVIAGSLCGFAIVLITTLGRRATTAAPAPAFAFDDMPTHEFTALREAVLARDPQPRTCRSQPARRGHARARTTRGAAQTSRA
jgi:hypothetical protein